MFAEISSGRIKDTTEAFRHAEFCCPHQADEKNEGTVTPRIKCRTPRPCQSHRGPRGTSDPATLSHGPSRYYIAG